jgi:hypothetical protein
MAQDQEHAQTDEPPETEGERELEGDDPVTKREELEQELMAEGKSDEGAEIGDHID